MPAKQTSGFADNGVHPDRNRPKQYLEQFPLDGLKMVGTLKIDGVRYALIKDSNNIVTRVTAGDYMGQNDGKVIRISEAGIKLREIIANGLGGWTQRPARLPLSD
jgi:type IV pilus assembly protein PilP